MQGGTHSGDRAEEGLTKWTHYLIHVVTGLQAQLAQLMEQQHGHG